jgi:hypothetical protein
MLSPAGPAGSIPRKVLEDHVSAAGKVPQRHRDVAGREVADPAGTAPPVADDPGAGGGAARPDARRRQMPPGTDGVDMEAMAT